MKHLTGPTAAVIALTILPATGFAQESDAAAERARLAEQRIQAEAARRLEEEQANAAVSPPAAEPAAQAPERVARPRQDSRREASADLSLALDQLRTLGELRDRGYVDDEEFERIKQRILDANL